MATVFSCNKKEEIVTSLLQNKAPNETKKNGTVSYTWKWTAPTVNEDGSPIAGDLSGYKVYYGTSSAVYTNTIDVGNVLQATINDLPADTIHYFAITAYDFAGNESVYSTEKSHIISSLKVKE